MTAHDSLLRAVCERPFDDGPRLVYADWLDEHGEPERARFIRTGIEKNSPFVFPSGAAVLINHVDDDGQFVLADAIEGVSFAVSRGFPSVVSLSLRRLLGGPCERCEGEGGIRVPPPTWAYQLSRICHDCNGTGRTPGLARALSRWPIVEVRVPNFDAGDLPLWLMAAHLARMEKDDGRSSGDEVLSRLLVDLIRSLAEPPLKPIFGNGSHLPLRPQVERVAQ